MHNGCILCGRVGSGKSLTALAYYYKVNGGDADDILKHPMNDPPQDLYVITTAKKRDEKEWEIDMAKLLIGDEGIYQHKVIVDSWNKVGQYTDVKDSFFIFDEQRVVGSGAWTKAFLKIARGNNWILLSATPGDNWADYVPVFIANGYVRTRSQFNHDHVIFSPFTRFPKVDRYINTGTLMKWRDEILVPMGFGLDVEQSVDIHAPVSNIIDVHVSYDRDKYKRVSRRWNIYEDKPVENVSEFCYCLRRVLNSDVSRAQKCWEICHEKDRVIIFYNFNYELEALKKTFPGCNVAEWNGHKHEPVPDSDKWVYLVQYTAGAEGWNCIKTDTMIFYSLNYSYKIMEQARGRIDRLNTPYKELFYYRLWSQAPMDLAIMKCIKKKKSFNESSFKF